MSKRKIGNQICVIVSTGIPGEIADWYESQEGGKYKSAQRALIRFYQENQKEEKNLN